MLEIKSEQLQEILLNKIIDTTEYIQQLYVGVEHPIPENINVYKKPLIECVYCGQMKKPRFNSDDCNYCNDCEDKANEISTKN